MTMLRTLPPYPLDGVSRQWQPFIEQATTSATFFIGSVLLRTLAQEASARVLYTDAWKEYDREQDGMTACYSLCAALGELAGASQSWAQIAEYLNTHLEQEEDDYLFQLRELSIHNFQRVSFLQFSVQSELQEVAKRHKVLLEISVLEDREGAQESDEALEEPERN